MLRQQFRFHVEENRPRATRTCSSPSSATAAWRCAIAAGDGDEASAAMAAILDLAAAFARARLAPTVRRDGEGRVSRAA